MDTAPLLEVEIERKAFGARDVLRDLRLQVDSGEFLSLVGASGCGKSSLLRLIAGLDADFVGQVRFAGRPLHGLRPEIGFVFQEPRLLPWLSVAANVGFDLSGRGHLGARVPALLAEVGLAGLGDALPKQLSGGQAQRVAIARGLFHQPRLLLLDEPFSAVDAFTRMKLQDLLLRLTADHQITVLMVTHDIDEAVYLSDRVLVLDAQAGPLREQIALPWPRPRQRDDVRLAQARAEVLQALHAAHAF